MNEPLLNAAGQQYTLRTQTTGGIDYLVVLAEPDTHVADGIKRFTVGTTDATLLSLCGGSFPGSPTEVLISVGAQAGNIAYTDDNSVMSSITDGVLIPGGDAALIDVADLTKVHLIATAAGVPVVADFYHPS